MRFTKMQGIGNDYVYVNCFEEHVENPSELAKQISRRHYGVGSDGLILICPSDVADFEMKMYNADGSNGGMCGNGARCIGKYVYDRGLTDKTTVSLMTDSGLKILNLNVKDGKVQTVRVDMGMPELFPPKIPVDLPGEVVMGHRLNVGSATYEIHCVSMGNPHCVILCATRIMWIWNRLARCWRTTRFSAARECRVRAGCLPRSPADARVGARRGGDAGVRHGRMCVDCRGGDDGPRRPPCCDGFARRLFDAGLVT